MIWKKLLHMDELFETDEDVEPEDLFIPPDVPVSKRRIIVVGDFETVRNLSHQIDWKKFLPSYLLATASMDLINPFKDDAKMMDYSKKVAPAIEIEEAIKALQFPPQHPVNGAAYACYDLAPNYYFPLASFHEFIYQSKMNAFLELCSSLNAKEVIITYAEEDGEKLDITGKTENIPTNSGNLDLQAEVKYHRNRNSDASIFCSFPKSTRAIGDFVSPWIATEPTWTSLQKMRTERDVESLRAKFSHMDEMGVTSKLAGGLNKIGINIGGSYSNLRKRKFEFLVTFWPKENI